MNSARSQDGIDGGPLSPRSAAMPHGRRYRCRRRPADHQARRRKPPMPAARSGPRSITLGWTVKGDRLPPMVTAEPSRHATGAGRRSRRARHNRAVRRSSAVNGGWRSGGRLQGRILVRPRDTARASRSASSICRVPPTRFATDSNAHPILAQPFFNALNQPAGRCAGRVSRPPHLER